MAVRFLPSLVLFNMRNTLTVGPGKEKNSRAIEKRKVDVTKTKLVKLWDWLAYPERPR